MGRVSEGVGKSYIALLSSQLWSASTAARCAASPCNQIDCVIMLVLGNLSTRMCADSKKTISLHETSDCVLMHVATQAVVQVSVFKGMCIGVLMAQRCSDAQLTPTSRLASVAVMSSIALDASRMGTHRSVLIRQLLNMSILISDAPHVPL